MQTKIGKTISLEEKKKEIVFARPPFAREVFTDEAQKKFDELPGWQRHFLKQILKHGNVRLAAKESGVSTFINKNVDQTKIEQKTIQEALVTNGMDADFLVAHLKDCLEANTVKIDKNGNPMHVVDMKLKLETLRTIFQLTGSFDLGKKPQSNASALDMFEDTNLDE